MIIEEFIGSIARVSYSQATYLILDFSGESLRINFIGKKAFHLVKDSKGTFDIHSTHPLLLDYNETWATTYINSPAPEPELFLQKLRAVIDNITSELRTWTSYIPKGYLHNQQVLLRNLTEGNGFLLNAPSRITEAVIALCDEHKVKTKTFFNQVAPLEHKILVVGNCFVIAENFSAGF